MNRILAHTSIPTAEAGELPVEECVDDTKAASEAIAGVAIADGAGTRLRKAQEDD